MNLPLFMRIADWHLVGRRFKGAEEREREKKPTG
jgi:hypothetical protein